MTALITRHFQVFRGPSAVIDTIGPNVLALAGFDGVHSGHLALLERAADEAARRGLPVGAATFDDRHARRDRHPGIPSLTSLSQRIRLLLEAGMDFVVLFPGDPTAIGVPIEVFARRILLGIMHSQLMVIRGMSPTTTSITAVFDGEVLPVIRVTANQLVSTTRIRDLLSAGDIHSVNQLLSRTYEITQRCGTSWAASSTPGCRPRE